MLLCYLPETCEKGFLRVSFRNAPLSAYWPFLARRRLCFFRLFLPPSFWLPWYPKEGKSLSCSGIGKKGQNSLATRHFYKSDLLFAWFIRPFGHSPRSFVRRWFLTAMLFHHSIPPRHVISFSFWFPQSSFCRLPKLHPLLRSFTNLIRSSRIQIA